MNSNLIKKTVCLLVILAMVLTALTVTPLGLAGSRKAKNIHEVKGTVFYEDPSQYKELADATVVLLNLQTGEQKSTTTDASGGYLFDKVEPGHYEVYAIPPQVIYYTIESSSFFIEVDTANVLKDLRLGYFAEDDTTLLEGYVIDTNAVALINASVTLKSLAYPGYQITADGTNASGGYSIVVYQGMYELWATAAGFQYNITTVNLNATKIPDYNITLTKGESVISGIIEFDQTPEANLTKYLFLFNLDNGETYRKPFTGTVFNIKAYPGNFTLILDTPGYKPYYHPEVIKLDQVNKSFKFANNPKLETTGDENIVTRITFLGNNWDKFNLATDWTLNHDSELYGLEYVRYEESVTVGDPRFQIDAEPGFGGALEGLSSDGLSAGKVENTELTNFSAWLKDRGPYHPFTEDIFEIGGSYYSWSKASFKASTKGFNGYFNSTEDMVITTEATYERNKAQSLSGTKHRIDVTNLRETEIVKLRLPSNHEFTDLGSYDTSLIWIKSSRDCQINGSASVFVEKMRDPEAVIIMSDNYVKADKEVTFNGNESSPGSGTINNYTWLFGDGNVGYSKIAEHKYSAAGIYQVTLTVGTKANLFNSTSKNITVDARAPTASIIFQDDNGSVITEGDENTPDSQFNITFNASKSKDTLDGTNLGSIFSYYWSFGDITGQTSDKKIAVHSYNHPGEYTVTLNVTDAAGHYKEVTETIWINDKEAPTPQWKTEPDNTRVCEIDKWLIFNASISEDNYDSVENLTFRWDLDRTVDSDGNGIFEDDNDANQSTYNFSANSRDSFIITLWVWDSAGNVANTTLSPITEWTIDIAGTDLRFAPIKEDFPDKMISSSKKRPKEGEEVKFKVNLTNTGMITAWDVVVTFYVDGKEKGQKTIDSLKEEEFKVLTFKWKAKGVEKHNISFNVSLANLTFEYPWDNNYNSMRVEVLEEELISQECGVTIVIVAIIVIVLLIYLYRRKRMGGEFGLGKGKRRGEKGKGKDKGKGKGKGKGKKR